MRAAALTLACLFVGASADTYMNNPRGSNNRLNERSANRNNGDRLFDSQNNNRGGYNVGDKTNQPFDANNPATTFDETMNPTTNTATQYQMVFFEGSQLSWEWTAQHGCGGNEETDPHKLNCNMVLQYMCDQDSPAAIGDDRLEVTMRDGGNTDTPDEPNTYAEAVGSVKTSNANNQRGRHESEAYYYACRRTYRNDGLFHADQNLNGNDARYTRQNNNANRRGLECTEERDYYPWWNPHPWRDVAYLTDHVDHCPMIRATSQNTADVWFCAGAAEKDKTAPITQEECQKLATDSNDASIVWTKYNKNMGVSPDCRAADWSRVNHLGNGRDGQPLTYNQTLPWISQLSSWGVRVQGTTQKYARCVVRLRYNISTDDYDPWNTNSSQDDNPHQGIISPIRQNPTVDVGTGSLQGLRLAINTNQFGRTFQDRSHIFYILQRPASIAADRPIFNLNVRGKRGNIVQTFPAVEYDFMPNRLHVPADGLIHVQWTGSNTHNNGQPAGDGQAGDAGEGTGGTDRNNFVQMGDDLAENFPLPLDKFGATSTYANSIWKYVNCLGKDGQPLGGDWVDCALTLSTSGYFRSKNSVTTGLSVTLDNAPASLVGGVVLEIKSTLRTPAASGGAVGRQFNYMCTRNNSFSNRSQKGTLMIDA